MKRETQKINCILFNCILGLSELLWLFTTKQTSYNEVIFLLVIGGFILTFSTLTIIDSDEFIRRFMARIGFGFFLFAIAFILLWAF